MGPAEVLPQALGLRWGMSKEDCQRILGTAVLGESAAFLIVRLSPPNGPRDAVLLFDEGGLKEIEVKLCESRSFWEPDYTYEEVERIHHEYKERHAAIVRQYTLTLGEPCFEGTHHSEGYPDGQSAAYLAYWLTPGGRVQVELDRPDREFPFEVRVRCCRVDNERPE